MAETAQETKTPLEANAGSVPDLSNDEIQDRIIQTLKTCYDPEIPVDIYELGLIYEVRVEPNRHVHINMTLTSPMCPVAETLPPEVENKVRNMPEVETANVEVVWDPPWTPERMSEEARLELNFDL